MTRKRWITVALLLLGLLGCEQNPSQPLEEGEKFFDERHGEWTFYYPESESGQPRQVKAQGSYSFGAKEGPWEYFYPSGELRETGSYSSDQRHGEWVTFDKYGYVLSEGEYNFGTKTGQWHYYYPTTEADRVQGRERLRAMGQYREGKREGTWKRFDPQGNPAVMAEFFEGKRTGTWQRYLSPGEPPLRIDYQEIDPRFQRER